MNLCAVGERVFFDLIRMPSSRKEYGSIGFGMGVARHCVAYAGVYTNLGKGFGQNRYQPFRISPELYRPYL